VPDESNHQTMIGDIENAIAADDLPIFAEVRTVGGADQRSCNAAIWAGSDFRKKKDDRLFQNSFFFMAPG